MAAARGNSLLAARRLHLHRLIRMSKEIGRILCRLCGTELKGRTREVIVGNHVILNHAMMHLSEPAFRCRHCLAEFSTHARTRSHIKKTHRIAVAGKIEDRSDDFHAEILDTLTKCYDSST